MNFVITFYHSIVTENHSSDSESDIEKVKEPAGKKIKQNSLLDYHDGSSDSNGSSPFASIDKITSNSS